MSNVRSCTPAGAATWICEDTLREIVGHIHDEGGEAIYVGADVGLKADVQKIADAAIAKYGRIDTWINDAGVSIYGNVLEASDEDNRRQFDTNFWGVVYGCQVAVPLLKKQ